MTRPSRPAILLVIEDMQVLFLTFYGHVSRKSKNLRGDLIDRKLIAFLDLSKSQR